MRIPHEASSALGREFLRLDSDLVAGILETMRIGWVEGGLEASLSGAGEVEITERLRDGMRAALKSGRAPLGKSLIVAPGTESRSSPAITIPDGRTDIPLYVIKIFVRYAEHDPHAIIECKRIASSDTHLCREYVVEGIDRFRSMKYGENHAVGFMAGYLLDGEARTAAGAVNRYLSRVGRAREYLAESDVIDRPEFWRSIHDRAALRPPIHLHHAFFKFMPSLGRNRRSPSG